MAVNIQKSALPKTTPETIKSIAFQTNIIHKINNLQCLAVWIYLKTFSNPKEITKTAVSKHFNIGVHKVNKIFTFLKNSNLIAYHQLRDNQSKYSRIFIEVLDGTKFIKKEF